MMLRFIVSALFLVTCTCVYIDLSGQVGDLDEETIRRIEDIDEQIQFLTEGIDPIENETEAAMLMEFEDFEHNYQDLVPKGGTQSIAETEQATNPSVEPEQKSEASPTAEGEEQETKKIIVPVEQSS